MVTKKKAVAKKVTVSSAKPFTKQKKVTVSRAKPFTKQKKVVQHQRVQTAEGWKRKMLKLRASKEGK